MSTVFISYSNIDRDFVERLVSDLDTAGLDVFYDQRVKPGDSWANSLSQAIESSTYMLVVLTPESVQSKWVSQEIQMGLAREADGLAQVIPLLLRPCEIPQSIADKAYVSFEIEYEPSFRRLLPALVGTAPLKVNPSEMTGSEVRLLKTSVETFKTAPQAQLEAKPSSGIVQDRKKCFVIMPFGNEELQIVYEDFVKPVLLDDCGLELQRGDDVFGSDVIMDDIRTSIAWADLVVADLTGKNANVFYEVGICHTLEKPVLLLAQSMDDVPFDLRHRRVLLYAYSPRGCKRLERSLKSNIEALLTKLPD